MDPHDRILGLFQDATRLMATSAELLADPIAQAAHLITQSLLVDGKVLVCGNGGSAAVAQHFAAQLINRFELDRPGLACMALTSDGTALTSIANDHAFAQVFARQVSALGHSNDVLLAISTSGQSHNMIEAMQAAHARGMRVIALTGRDGGRMAEILEPGDAIINVPGENTARIQEVHLLCLHCLCDAVDCLLLGVE